MTESTDRDIDAYIDGELDLAGRFAVERRLADDPKGAARLMRDLSNGTALRMLLREGQAPTKTIKAGSRRKRFALAAGLCLCAGLGAGVLFSRTPPGYVVDAAASHRAAQLRAAMASQVETPSLDEVEMRRALQMAAPRLPDDWRVTDAQLFPSQEGPAMLIAVVTPAGEHLSLFAVRERSRAPARPDAVRRGRQSVAYWSRGPVSYALIGDYDPGTVDSIAERLAGSWAS